MRTSTSRRTTAQAAEAEGAPRLVTYPVPDGAPTNASYTVKVRTPGGSWQNLGTYLATLNLISTATGAGQIQNSSLAFFDFADTVEVEVGYVKGGMRKARIRPDSYGIEPELRADTVRFELTEPRNLVVQVNDEVFDALHLFARPLETDRPAPDDPDVLYFGPGLHTTEGGVVTVPSGRTVYLDGGAVLRSRVHFKDVANAGLAGRGVIWASPGGGCTVEGSRNIAIGAVTMLNPDGYAVTVAESESVTITGLGSFSSKAWGDGIDIFSSSDVTIDGVFMRNADDCIAIYTHRWEYYGDTRDITVRNSTLWADVAHPINVGTHGNTDAPEVLENLTFQNIDVCDHREPQILYQGVLALNPGDSNLIRNVRVDGMRVEDFREGQLINMRIMFNEKYNTSAGRGIDGVHIKDLSYTGTHAGTALLIGYDKDRLIQNITFENLVVNGTVIADSMTKPSWFVTSDYVPMYANEHVKALKFITTAEAAGSVTASPDTP
ncbi:glycosyl hydrolase family 28 protein [Streptomyces sp. NBC_00038]|uniref:glycosyl hydrolase family 28 protein n=1 Tax=Streptomyces sp. NBC_00038 TaxID=2903615 RepID=UPI002258BA24|nr:glycosyl hydrolase family 28 protein [Streptomyces sp. NBC_00038]MCX5561613.1 glycosyl hydrolase family 28 protein [Streptomyces sp. NBC_00038]